MCKSSQFIPRLFGLTFRLKRFAPRDNVEQKGGAKGSPCILHRVLVLSWFESPRVLIPHTGGNIPCVYSFFRGPS